MLCTREEALEFVKIGYFNTIISATCTGQETNEAGEKTEETMCVPFYFNSLIFDETSKTNNELKELSDFCLDTKDGEKDVKLELKLYVNDQNMPNAPELITVSCLLSTQVIKTLDHIARVSVFESSIRNMMSEAVKMLIKAAVKANK